MTFWAYLKENFKTNTSLRALQTAEGIKVVKAPVLPVYKSAYEQYWEARGETTPTDNKPLSSEEMQALIESMTFQLMKGREEIELKKIKDALHLLNKKSPTGRLILKQIPAGIEINTKKVSSALGWIYPGYKDVFLNRDLFPRINLENTAAILAHEFGHIVEHGLVRPFIQNEGYYDEKGRPFSFHTALMGADSKHYFVLNKLSEAEKQAIDYQILSELMNTWQIGKRGLEKIFFMCVQSFLKPVTVTSEFLRRKKMLAREGKKNTFTKTSWEKRLSTFLLNKQGSLRTDFIWPKCRYFYFKTLFRFFPSKEENIHESKTAAQLGKQRPIDIQQKAAQKAISSSIKNLLNFSSDKKERESTLLVFSNLLVNGTLMVGTMNGQLPPSLLLLGNGFIGLSGLWLLYKEGIRYWNFHYNRYSFNSLSLEKEEEQEKSEILLNRMLQVFADKYKGMLTPEEIGVRTVDNWEEYSNYFKQLEKIQRLDKQVFEELRHFVRIQWNLMHPKKMMSQVVSPSFYDQQRKAFRKAFLTTASAVYDEAQKEAQQDSSRTVDDCVRAWILNAYQSDKVSPAAADVSGITMWEVTKDPNLILFLAQKGVELTRSECGKTVLLTQLDRTLKEDPAFQKAFEQQLGVQGRKKILRKLVTLYQCYQGEKELVSLARSSKKRYARGAARRTVPKKER